MANYGSVPPYPQGPHQPGPYPPAPGYGAAPPRNGAGVWALVLGILSLFCFGILAGIPAIICGVSARKLARQGQATNPGMGLAGIILGSISIALTLIFVGLLIAGGGAVNFHVGTDPSPSFT